MWAGGLGISNLKWMNIALQARWIWLQKADGDRPWSEFKINVPAASLQICNAATRAIVGNGNRTMFWEDKWIDGEGVKDIAPLIYRRVRNRVRANRTVA